jgi:ParB family chromosome partitioning protein
MVRKKGLDLGLIQERVISEEAATVEDKQGYKEPPNYVDRRIDIQNKMGSGKREKRLTYRIDPATCMIREDHDRNYNNLNEKNCRELIDGIKMHGQETPAIVRQLDNNEKFQYELVCGARRHWVANYLKTDFIVEVRDLSEEEVFIISDEENRNRQDISDYERAIKYKKALGGLYQSQVQMSERMGVSKDWLSRYLDLASMDQDIIKAYSDLSEIKVRHARELKSLMKEPAQAELILAAAKGMHENPQKGAIVMAALKSAAKIKTKLTKGIVRQYVTSSNKAFMQAKAISPNKLVLEINLASDASLEDWLAAVTAVHADYQN